MKKQNLWLLGLLLVGFLFIGVELFAADGDLIVNGKIGVGTAAPTEKLDVNGKVKATGFVGPGIIRQIKTINPTTGISTTSTAFVDMPGMSITLTTGPGNSTLLIFWNATLLNTAGNWVIVKTLLDNVAAGPTYGGDYTAGADYVADSSGGHTVASVSTGTHTVKLQWAVNGGTGASYPAYGQGRTLTVIEVGQ